MIAPDKPLLFENQTTNPQGKEVSAAISQPKNMRPGKAQHKLAVNIVSGKQDQENSMVLIPAFIG